jgi:hypothetical protein
MEAQFIQSIAAIGAQPVFLHCLWVDVDMNGSENTLNLH